MNCGKCYKRKVRELRDMWRVLTIFGLEKAFLKGII